MYKVRIKKTLSTIIFIYLPTLAYADNVIDKTNQALSTNYYSEAKDICLENVHKLTLAPAPKSLDDYEKQKREKEEVTSACIGELKAKHEELTFNSIVFQEFRNTSYWLESADWLQNHNYYIPLALEICKTNAKGKPLHRPETIYPKAVRMRGISGDFIIEANFDKNGYFVKAHPWDLSFPENDRLHNLYNILYNSLVNTVKNTRLCPITDTELTEYNVKIPFQLILDQ